MTEIECIRCKQLVDVPRGIDEDKFEGIVICQLCDFWMDIKIVNSKVQKRKAFDKGKIIFTADDYETTSRLMGKSQTEDKKLVEENLPKSLEHNDK